MDAIVAATSVAAETIGMESVHGVIEHGRSVDFVFLKEDPLADIANLRSVEAVWKNAVRYDRNTFRPRFRSDDAPPTARAAGAASARDILEAWLEMWRRYDLDGLGDVFVDDPALTYFPSDGQTLLEGLDAVTAYHEGIGFVSGGFQPESELWLDDVTISDFGESAVVGAVWHFGSRVDQGGVPRGPLTLVMSRTPQGLRITHVNFGNYPPDA